MRICNKCNKEQDDSAFYTVPVGDKLSRQCRDCKKRYERQRRKNYPEIYRDYELRSHFKLPIHKYVELLKAQNGVCAICKRPETQIRKGKLLPLVVDHSHITGKNRRLLCHKCNSGLGFFEDSPELLLAAIQYLKSFE